MLKKLEHILQNEIDPAFSKRSRFIFEEIEKSPPGKNDEIQLADAMNLLAKSRALYGMPLQGNRFDAGDKLGYLKANVEVALKHPEVAAEFEKYLIDVLKGKI